MSDAITTIAELKDLVKGFIDARSWGQYHSPKNVVMSLACETAELMEHFLWVDIDEARRIVYEPEQRAKIADELADVAYNVLNMSLVTGIDLSEALRAKMVKNEAKYPTATAAGIRDNRGKP